MTERERELVIQLTIAISSTVNYIEEADRSDRGNAYVHGALVRVRGALELVNKLSEEAVECTP